MSDWSRRRFLQWSAAAGLGLGAGCGTREPAPEPASGDTAPKAPALDADAIETPAADAAPPASPNIVLLVLDTVRADLCGLYGYELDTTPALDKLAAEGVAFDRVVTQNSWTRPSMGSMLTSLHPRTIGIYQERNQILNSQFHTLATRLKAHGYTTIGATANPNINSAFNFHRGFDTYVDSTGAFAWMLEPEDRENMREARALPTSRALFAGVNEAIDRREGEGPFYLQLNLMEVHEWYIEDSMIRPEYADRFLDAGMAYPAYLQSLRQLTDDMGAFVEELAARPGWKNTLFAIVSDHGEGLDSHPDVANSTYHGRLLYESNVVVPWVLHNPAWRPAWSRVPQPVRLLELMPTLLDFAGAPIPEGIAGVSLFPLLTGAAEAVELPRGFVAETQWRDTSKIGVYEDQWKLFQNRTRHPGLAPHELQRRGGGENGAASNLIAQHAGVAGELRDYLREWEERHPRVRPTRQDQPLAHDDQAQLEAIGYLS